LYSNKNLTGFQALVDHLIHDQLPQVVSRPVMLHLSNEVCKDEEDYEGFEYAKHVISNFQTQHHSQFEDANEILRKYCE
jgi:hypothetical protein